MQVNHFVVYNVYTKRATCSDPWL